MNKESRKFKKSIYMPLARIGKSFASPKRLEILDLLMLGPTTVEDIAKGTEMSVANTSQHLQTLLESRLVEFEKKGIYSYYKLADQAVADIFLSLQILGEKLNTEIQSLIKEVHSQNEAIEKIKMDQLIERIKNEHVTLIDVMPKKYYELQHIPGSSSIPLDELEKNLPTLPLDKEVVAYCRGRYCLLSVQAVKILKSHGYKALLLEESASDWNSKTDEE